MAKKKSREEALEEAKKKASEAIQEKLRAITEAVQNHLEGIQKKLEPIQEHLSQLLPRLQQAAILLQNRIDEAELEYKEVAEFYRDWTGKTPPRFKRFLDWFFEMNDDKSLGELLEHPFEVNEEDLEQAGLWLLNKIQFEGVKTKLERLGLPPEDIEYLEAVNNTIDAVPMSVKSPALAREYVKGITSQMEGFSYEAQAIVLEDVSKYFKKLPEGQVWLKASIWIRNAIEQYLAELNQPAKQPKPAPQAFGPEPTTKVWALYYWYKREVGLHPELHSTGKKKKNLEALAQQHGISSQNLYQTFNAIGRNSEKNPKRNPANIEMVIPLLADFPEAQQLAKNELERKK